VRRTHGLNGQMKVPEAGWPPYLYHDVLLLGAALFQGGDSLPVQLAAPRQRKAQTRVSAVLRPGVGADSQLHAASYTSSATFGIAPTAANSGDATQRTAAAAATRPATGARGWRVAAKRARCQRDPWRPQDKRSAQPAAKDQATRAGAHTSPCSAPKARSRFPSSVSAMVAAA